MGISDSLHNWIRSFLSNRKQLVVVEGVKSSPMPVLSGVPQGTVLGPLLFLVYINDICDNLSPGTKLRLFAEDSSLYREIKTEDDIKILQKDLDTLQDWETLWKMEFHPGKCQVLRITNKIKFLKGNYFIHNTLLQEQKSAKYLGVVIDSHLNWSDQYSAVIKKANKTLAFLRRNLYDCPSKVKSDCYTTLIRPCLEYGCSAWDPYQKNDIKKLEQVQKRAARFITGNYCLEHGSTEANMKKLGFKPLRERRAVIKLNLFYKARHSLVEIPMSHLKINRVATRRQGDYAIPDSNLDSHKNSFYPSTIRLWNTLPAKCKQASTADSFKNLLSNQTVRSAY